MPDLGFSEILFAPSVHQTRPTESVSENFPPRIPRWTGKISARILGGNFPSEDSSLDEKKATEEVVLVKFFVVHVSKNCCLESTED